MLNERRVLWASFVASGWAQYTGGQVFCFRSEVQVKLVACARIIRIAKSVCLVRCLVEAGGRFVKRPRGVFCLMTASLVGNYIVGRSARTIGKHRKSESSEAVVAKARVNSHVGKGTGMISVRVCRACRASCIDARCAAVETSTRLDF